MKPMVLVLVAMMCCILTSPTVTAGPDDATVKLARSLFDKGDTAYNLGKFTEAIRWFTRAYEAWPNPDFLYNIAQSYRLAGNCTQALFFYRRYLSIKERDKAAPLANEERIEIEHFIKDCEALTNAKPNGPKVPNRVGTDTAGPSNDPPSPSPQLVNEDLVPPPMPTLSFKKQTGGNDPAALDSTSTIQNATLVSAYATGGLAMLSGRGRLSIPVQPSFAVGAGYPLPIGLFTLEVGARASYLPIRYDAMSVAKRSSLIGMHATLGVTYQVNSKLGVRGDAGIGVAILRGLANGNPFTDRGKAGAFTMPSLRIGIAAEYSITPNIIATIASLSLSFSPASNELAINSLIEFDILIGIGCRM